MIISKIKWVVTWLSFLAAKISLRYRLEEGGADFLQPIATGNVNLYNRVDFILSVCKDKKVVHVGFSDHPFTNERIKDKSLLHLQLQTEAKSLAGVDIEADAIALYISQTGDQHVYLGDITKSYPGEAISLYPDIILVSEVLEHLRDPHTAVDVLYESFPHATSILVTVPNYTALDSIAASLNKTESIHPHHYWYFSPFTLRRLFDEPRFKMEQLHFGMYYQQGKSINAVMRQFPYNGDCIIAVFTINKN